MNIETPTGTESAQDSEHPADGLSPRGIWKFGHAYGLRRLVTLPSLHYQIFRACVDPLRSLEHLHTLVKYDPVLVAKLIDAASERAPSNQPLHIETVIAETSKQQIKALLFSSCAERYAYYQRKRQAAFETTQKNWLRSTLTGLICRSLSFQFDYDEPEVAYYVGLLSNIGQWMLHSEDLENYPGLLNRHTDIDKLYHAEQQEYGYDQVETAAQLIQNWRVASPILNAIKYGNATESQLEDAEPLHRIVFLARTIVDSNALNLSDVEQQAKRLFKRDNVQIFRLVESALNQLSELVSELKMNIPAKKMPPILQPFLIDDQLHLNVQETAKCQLLIQDTHLCGSIDAAGAVFIECQTRTEIQENASYLAKNLFGCSGSLFFSARNSEQLSASIPGVTHIDIGTDNHSSLIAQSARLNTPQDSADQEPEALAIIDQGVMAHLNAHVMMCVPISSSLDNPNYNCEGVLVLGFAKAGNYYWTKQRALINYFAFTLATQWRRIEFNNRALKDAIETESALHNASLKRMVHEVNNPLSIARNIAHLLTKNKGGEDPEVAESLAKIDTEIQRASELLKKYTDMQCNGSQENAVNINETIADLLDVFENGILKKKEIVAFAELDQSIPPVYIDVESVKQILTNLIKNAAESMMRGGLLTIQTHDKVVVDAKTYVEIRVIDDGPGVPDDVIERLFSPVRSEKGAGLGLSIVKELTQKMDGFVSYQRADGNSLFSVYLRRQIENRSTTP